jgi:hypothetical protein
MRKRDGGRFKYEIKITSDSVEAICGQPFGPKQSRTVLGTLLIGLGIWGIYRSWLSHDSYGHNNWWYLAHHYTVLNFDSVVMSTAILFLFMLLGVRLFCPAGAILICNRAQVTTTRIPWHSFTGHWVSRTYNVSDVSGFRLGYFGSGRGGNVYGIRFLVNGSKKTIFLGSIDPPEAYRILHGLKSLGLDVANDPKLLSRVKAGLLDRKEEELDRRMRI